MSRRGRCACGKGFYGLLFAAACVMLGWPVVTLVGDGPGLFAYLFLSGAAIVLALACASWRHGGGTR